MMLELLALSLLLNVCLFAAYVREKRRRPAKTIVRHEYVSIDVTNTPYITGTYLKDLPFDRDLLFRAADELRKRDWNTANLGGAGQSLSLPQGRLVRNWLIYEKEFAEWKNTNCNNPGWYLNGQGRTFMREIYQIGVREGILELTPPPRKTVPVNHANSRQMQINTHIHRGVT